MKRCRVALKRKDYYIIHSFASVQSLSLSLTLTEMERNPFCFQQQQKIKVNAQVLRPEHSDFSILCVSARRAYVSVCRLY